MNLTLKRISASVDGIFSELLDETGKALFSTLEHAYDSGNGDGSFAPKIPNGTYKCVRGQHRLAHMAHPFDTFEITGVKGHTNILFHRGNWNRDSDGCVLVGKAMTIGPDGVSMITSSHDAFTSFMNMQSGVDEFILTVEA